MYWRVQLFIITKITSNKKEMFSHHLKKKIFIYTETTSDICLVFFEVPVVLQCKNIYIIGYIITVSVVDIEYCERTYYRIFKNWQFRTDLFSHFLYYCLYVAL